MNGRYKDRDISGQYSYTQAESSIWIVEFKKTRRGESLIAFDSLFKDALLPSSQAD